MESGAALMPPSLNVLLLSAETKIFQKYQNMKIQHFINVRGKVEPDTKTAGVKFKFFEKKNLQIVRTNKMS